MNIAEINARFEQIEALCEADERHDICEQYRQWIYAAEERAAELQRRLDAIVSALDPGPMPVLEQFQFNLRPQGDFKHAHDQWTQRRHIYETIKAIAEGEP